MSKITYMVESKEEVYPECSLIRTIYIPTEYLAYFIEVVEIDNENMRYTLCNWNANLAGYMPIGKYKSLSGAKAALKRQINKHGNKFYPSLTRDVNNEAWVEISAPSFSDTKNAIQNSFNFTWGENNE